MNFATGRTSLSLRGHNESRACVSIPKKSVRNPTFVRPGFKNYDADSVHQQIYHNLPIRQTILLQAYVVGTKPQSKVQIFPLWQWHTCADTQVKESWGEIHVSHCRNRITIITHHAATIATAWKSSKNSRKCSGNLNHILWKGFGVFGTCPFLEGARSTTCKAKKTWVPISFWFLKI